MIPQPGAHLVLRAVLLSLDATTATLEARDGARLVVPRALVARCRVVTEPECYRRGDLVLDVAAATLSRPGATAQLTERECAVARALMQARKPVTGAALAQRVWGSRGAQALVFVYVQKIRRKIEPDPRHPIYLINVRRYGGLCFVSDV